MSKNENLMIDEEELKNNCVAVNKAAHDLEKKIERYIAIMNDIAKNAISSGKVHKNLIVYNKKIEAMRGQPALIASSVTKHLYNFLEKVEKDDKYIY